MEKDFRLKMFHWIVQYIFRHPEAEILPGYLAVLGCLFMPIRGLRYFACRGQFNYDPASDIFTIYGMKYAADLFRSFAEGGLATGRWLRIVKREDGVVRLGTVSPQIQEQFNALLEFEENCLRSHEGIREGAMKNILCKLFGHLLKAEDASQGVAGPTICIRCGHKEPGIKWPRKKTWPPKLETR